MATEDTSVPTEVTTEKWLETVAKAQAAAKREKPNGSNEDAKKPEKLSRIELLSGSTWDTFAPPPSNSFKVSCHPRHPTLFRLCFWSVALLLLPFL